jgi:hypothetical protein
MKTSWKSVAPMIALACSRIAMVGETKQQITITPLLHEELGHFGDAADVLRAVRIREAEVAVDACANVVAIEHHAEATAFMERPFQGDRDGALSAAAEAGHPNHATLLTEQFLLVRTGQQAVLDGVYVAVGHDKALERSAKVGLRRPRPFARRPVQQRLRLSLVATRLLMATKTISAPARMPDPRTTPTIDQVGIEERVARIKTRSIKKETKVQGMKLALSMIDLTTLGRGRYAEQSAAALLQGHAPA